MGKWVCECVARFKNKRAKKKAMMARNRKMGNGKYGRKICLLSLSHFCHICGTIKESSGRRRISMRKVGKNRLRDSIESL